MNKYRYTKALITYWYGVLNLYQLAGVKADGITYKLDCLYYYLGQE